MGSLLSGLVRVHEGQGVYTCQPKEAPFNSRCKCRRRLTYFPVHVEGCPTKEQDPSIWVRRPLIPWQDTPTLLPGGSNFALPGNPPCQREPPVRPGEWIPLTREDFVREVKAALSMAQINHQGYFGHSFQIGAATAAATIGLPIQIIKMLGRRNFDAYMLYTCTPREALATVPRATAQGIPLIFASVLLLSLLICLLPSSHVRSLSKCLPCS